MKIISVAVVLFMSLSVLADEKITTYYAAVLKDKETVIKDLTANGFEILGAHQVNGEAEMEVVLFTNAELLAEAKKEDRGFAGAMKLLINKKAKEIRVLNPIYFLKAIMQNDYTPSVADSVKTKLTAALGELTETADKLKSGQLSDYHFMFGMPYYKEMIRVGSSDYLDCMEKKGKIIFKKDLGGATLAAFGLAADVEGFPKKLDLSENSLVLPYMVVVGKEAKIMHPKYFIALSFPRLGMGQFMTISDIPGKIEDQLTCK